jgi:multiple sugar transport system substrate-binding protein
MFNFTRLFITSFLVIFLIPYSSLGTELRIGILIINKNQRNVVRKISERFKKEHPDIKISWEEKDNKGYHESINRWLKKDKQIDIYYSFAGYRVISYVKQGLIEPIDDIWKKNRFDRLFPNMINSVSYNKIPYALPISYYQWGFYYNINIFKKYNITPPKNWIEFLAICEKLKKNGITPISIGLKNNWPAASWFTYLNLRVNGIEFYQKLVQGKVAYTDPRVKNVMNIWKELLDKGYFLEKALKYDWKGATPYLERGLSAMYLIGNFASTEIRNESRIGFFPFPVIDAKIQRFEEAPTDVFLISKSSKNKKAAKTFLTFFSRADIQHLYNESIGFISPNIYAPKSRNKYIKYGSELLEKTKKVTQYFDRDSPFQMGEDGFKAFGQFMIDRKIEKFTNEMEVLRKKHFKKLTY